MRTLERRIVTATSVRAEFSSTSPGSIGKVAGYASTYNNPTKIGSDFVERVAPGCFDRAIREKQDTRCLFNHSADKILGRVSNGSLRLRSDSAGLIDECDLPDVSYARDLLASIRRADIDGQSFGFIPTEEDWDETDDPEDRSRRIPLRTLRSVSLIDVSFVTWPQYDGTSASASRSRSFETLFPDGVPVEIRSRFGSDFRARFEARADRRRRVTNEILSI